MVRAQMNHSERVLQPLKSALKKTIFQRLIGESGVGKTAFRPAGQKNFLQSNGSSLMDVPDEFTLTDVSWHWILWIVGRGLRGLSRGQFEERLKVVMKEIAHAGLSETLSDQISDHCGGST